MSTPRVTEIAPNRVATVRDDFADTAEPARPTRMTPYHRPSQRDLVRHSLSMSGAFDDFHGDRKRRV